MGFHPSKWVDVGGLCGDSGDNIHGVMGVGPVNATKLIKEYGSFEGVFEGLRAKAKVAQESGKKKDQLGKKEQAILDQEAVARLALSLKRMDDVPDAPRIRDYSRKDPQTLRKWMASLGFVSLLKDADALCNL